jgi:hypothetical protein
LWAWRTRHTFAAQFTALLIAVAAAAHILQWSGDGVVGNSQFDLVIATAIGLGLAYEHAAVIAPSPRWASASVRVSTWKALSPRLIPPSDSTQKADLKRREAPYDAEAASKNAMQALIEGVVADEAEGRRAYAREFEKSALLAGYKLGSAHQGLTQQHLT